MQSPTKSNDAVNHPKRSQSRGRNAQPSPRKDETRSYKTKGMLFGDLCPVEHNAKLDPPVKACFNCWSIEHYRKSCTQPETYSYCCNCGRRGLTVKECPRCARAFYALSRSKKHWIYREFFNCGSNLEQTTPKKRGQDYKDWDDYYDEKQATQKKESQRIEYWDEYYDEKQMLQKKESQREEYWDDYYGEKQTLQNKESQRKEEYDYWDDYDENNCQSPSVDSHVKNASIRSKMYELKDEDFVWEPSESYHSLETAYAEPHVLFDYLQHKKIIDEWKSDEIKKAVNLDETRMAEMDSLDENSIMSIEDSSKKDERLSCLSGDPLRDLLCLLDAVKHLSIKTQDVIVTQYMDERKQLLAGKDAKLLKSQ